MNRLIVLLPLLSLTLAGCANSTVRTYLAVPAAGLTSSFTEHCAALRLIIDNGAYTVDPNSDSRIFVTLPNPGTTTVTAQCLVMSLGEYAVTGQSSISVSPKTINVAIGSGEGSTEAGAFAKTATVTGVFPIIRTP